MRSAVLDTPTDFPVDPEPLDTPIWNTEILRDMSAADLLKPRSLMIAVGYYQSVGW